ncbi:conserved virulence factor C family protein [Chengkuizengella axinellae]|uniref:Conserved virulence factor C family protein n=1 Tax=Chengkuizengella axinellae TaxID=3064388 RepID=A0ABT9IWU7_9BACL|nr:conserved virulence factor C family protein [Chengkuizengella sp. 2205SS18-9]MDP5273284.1 conserved virulence factor C family protein [Chengkuizengella sp. 2205SS18-9]
MKILSIEPTPSPNSMKINIDESLPTGVRKTYTSENKENAPELMKKILGIDGVVSIFHTVDFLAIDRLPNADWKMILGQVKEIFGEGQANIGMESVDEGFGEVKVYVQTFRKIPMQIRVKSEMEEVRENLSERFTNAAIEAGLASPNLIKERKLEEWGIRYGEPKEIAEEVLEELDASYDEKRIKGLLQQAQNTNVDAPIIIEKMSPDEVNIALDSPDWRRRFAAFDQLEPTTESLPIISKALKDQKSSIRRLAIVYLGEIEHDQVLPLLYDGLMDSSVSVRRTAGDTISDIGNPEAIQPMIKALEDKNKLVRWRAARFLYEVGDETAVSALQEAENDPEFEVSLQVKMALERINSGEEAAGTIWQQMTKSRK